MYVGPFCCSRAQGRNLSVVVVVVVVVVQLRVEVILLC